MCGKPADGHSPAAARGRKQRLLAGTIYRGVWVLVCEALGPMVCGCEREDLRAFELFELYEHVSWLSRGALTLNLAIVAFMLYNLFHARAGTLKMCAKW
ncbi:MAG: hypothetical protein ABI167_07055 [Nitrosospira sp.]